MNDDRYMGPVDAIAYLRREVRTLKRQMAALKKEVSVLRDQVPKYPRYGSVRP